MRVKYLYAEVDRRGELTIDKYPYVEELENLTMTEDGRFEICLMDECDFLSYKTFSYETYKSLWDELLRSGYIDLTKFGYFIPCQDLRNIKE